MLSCSVASPHMLVNTSVKLSIAMVMSMLRSCLSYLSVVLSSLNAFGSCFHFSTSPMRRLSSLLGVFLFVVIVGFFVGFFVCEEVE